MMKMYQLTFTPEYVKTVQTRVRRGIKWLRKHKGERWFDKITLKTFDIKNADLCILGQTFKDEARAENYDGFNFAHDTYEFPNDAVDHGFNLTDEEVEFDNLPNDQRKNAVNPWTLLGEMWIHEIRLEKKRVGPKRKRKVEVPH